jgi:hypothetical protein
VRGPFQPHWTLTAPWRTPPGFLTRVLEGRGFTGCGETRGAVILNAFPLSPCQHHPGARRATPPHLRRGGALGAGVVIPGGTFFRSLFGHTLPAAHNRGEKSMLPGCPGLWPHHSVGWKRQNHLGTIS